MWADPLPVVRQRLVPRLCDHVRVPVRRRVPESADLVHELGNEPNNSSTPSSTPGHDRARACTRSARAQAPAKTPTPAWMDARELRLHAAGRQACSGTMRNMSMTDPA